MSTINWLIRASIRRPGKFVSVIRGSCRDKLLKNSLEKNFTGKNVEYSIPHFTSPETVNKMIRDLENEEIKVKRYRIKKEDYEQFLSKADYARYKYYYDGGKAPIMSEKAMEHFLAAKLLDISSADVYIDIANGDSPAPWVYERLYGCKSYAHDRYFKSNTKSLISGSADHLNIEASFANKLALHCAFDHFTKDYDSKFMKEVERILKPNGKCCIVLLYLYPKVGVVTDPGYVTDWSILQEFENIFVDYSFKNDFSRFYNAKTLKQRILSMLPDNLSYSIIFIENMEETCHECYAKFSLLLTKG